MNICQIHVCLNYMNSNANNNGDCNFQISESQDPPSQTERVADLLSVCQTFKSFKVKHCQRYFVGHTLYTM